MSRDGTSELPVIASCDSCGACCMLTPLPPFEPGEDAMYDIPDEAARLIRKRIDPGQEFDRLPCVWFDSTALRCRFYDIRPSACRRFEINSPLCRISRWDTGVDL